MISALKPYRPALVLSPEGFEQSFTANVVHVDADLVAFGDVLRDDPRGLPHGTPIHSLLVHIGEDGPEMIEFNDQDNTVAVDALASVRIAGDHVRFVFRREAGPFAGRVSLATEIEVFENVRPDEEAETAFARFRSFDEVQLGAIIVRFEVDRARLEALREKLRELFL